MKKTKMQMMVSAGYVSSTWKRVWTDGKDLFVKIDGEWRNVTAIYEANKNLFVED